MSDRASATVPVPSEVEAKLLVDDRTDLTAIAKLRRLGVYRLVSRDRIRLHSIYLDTPDFALTRCGVALRLRRQRGQWEATAKWGGGVEAEVHERFELTVPLGRRPALPFELPPGALRNQLLAIVAGRALRPVMVTEIQRQRLDLWHGDADHDVALAELALDQVSIRRDESAPVELSYCEAEIEQTGGQRTDIYAAARLLARRFRLRPSIESKFARGMLQLYGPHAAPLSQPRIASADSLATAARALAGRHLAALRAADPLAREGGSVEAIHDLRVAVRRLRALVHLFPDAFAGKLLPHLTKELAWLGDELGKLRDLDVQLAQLAHDAARSPAGHRRGLDGYRRYLEERRAAAQITVGLVLDSERYLGLLLSLERFAASPARRRPGPAASSAEVPFAAAAHDGLKRAFRRLRKRGEEVRHKPSPEDLHALRIRTKRLRYLVEFVGDLAGKPGARLLRSVVHLQDLLGAYHDDMVTADTVRSYVEGCEGHQPSAALLALSSLVSQHLHSAEARRSHFDQEWSRFVRRRTRSVRHAVLRALERAAQRAASQQAATRRAMTAADRKAG